MTERTKQQKTIALSVQDRKEKKLNKLVIDHVRGPWSIQTAGKGKKLLFVFMNCCFTLSSSVCFRYNKYDREAHKARLWTALLIFWFRYQCVRKDFSI